MVFDINVRYGEGIEPSLCQDLIDTAKSQELLELSNNSTPRVAYNSIGLMVVHVGIDMTIDKYHVDNIFIVSIELDEEEFYHKELQYSFYINFIIALYKRNVIGKYIVKTQVADVFKIFGSYPVGIKDVDINKETINWVVDQMLYRIDTNRDYDIIDTIFENMSAKQFNDIKDELYNVIMRKKEDFDKLTDLWVLYPNRFMSDEFRFKYMHYCNKFAIEANDDTTIGL